MLDTSTPPLSPNEVNPEEPAQGITHARQGRQPQPPQTLSSQLIIAEVPVRSSLNGKRVMAQVPLAWPSLVSHHPDVNLNITRFLLTVQHLSRTYSAWGANETTCYKVTDAFNELVEQWNSVGDSLGNCCGTNVRDVKTGMNKIRVLCASTITHDGANWILMKDSRPLFQQTVKEIIDKLKAKRHPEV